MNDMSTLIIPSNVDVRVRAASVDELRGELARALKLSAEHLVYLAAVWRELERRGEDLSALRTGIAAYLPEIAAGRLDAAAVIKFAGQSTLLRAVSSVPIEQQARLIAGEPIAVITLEQNGTYGMRSVAAEHMTAAQVRIAFDDHGIRAPEAQQAVLDSQRIASARRPIRAKAGKTTVRPDFATGTILVGRTRVTPGELIGALAQIYIGRDGESPVEATRTILMPLTEQEHRAIKMRAAEGGITVQRLLRGTLGAAGVLG